MGMIQHPTGLPLKSEQTFFEDPAVDRLMAMVMTLAAELHVTRDRLATLEMVIEQGQPVTRDVLDTFVPNPAQKEVLDSARQQFSDALMFCTLGVEASLGAPEEGVGKFDKS
ncbi:hypothetical protein [Puniceibacterium sp. IMCC21224]|uniref:hypothetical protein n=1 Tax=Puniceibacterium sp. IMCC21224 TaxID=1618204 RepID=UPI00064DC362|nr:hypothetical protein [Puniceibacterium sp. IMCC21224]KMK64916.1 hypothetical protein IMCC21224_12161 [Puniceibacterium sp. IMCC21224]